MFIYFTCDYSTRDEQLQEYSYTSNTWLQSIWIWYMHELVQLPLHPVAIWSSQIGLYNTKLHVFTTLQAYVVTKHITNGWLHIAIWIQTYCFLPACFIAGFLPAELNDLGATMIAFFQEFHQYLPYDSTPIPPTCCQEVLVKLTVTSEPSKVL